MTTVKKPKREQSGEKADTKPAVRSFEQSLPMLLMRAREVLMQRFRPHLRSHDVTEQQWRILRVLAEEESVEMLELAERCIIQPPSLSRTIPLLVSRGLLHRTGDRNDQRRVLVGLTPKGQALFRIMSAESAKIYAQLEADIGFRKLREIYRVLNALIADVERPL